VQVAISAFAFPSRAHSCLAPRAALGSPHPGHGLAQGPARRPSQGERCGFQEGAIREAWLQEAEGCRDLPPIPDLGRGQSTEPTSRERLSPWEWRGGCGSAG
jgi:hypothetical protein